jgi:pimeloyl-ACP methyl ester carboxylesterase
VRELPEVEGVEHRWIDLGGLRLHVAEAGAGDPLVMVHGWPQHWFEWRDLIPELAGRYRVICPDLRGFGWSDAPPGRYEKETLAGDLLGLLDVLELERVRLVGHDWGGGWALAFAQRAPERVERLALINSVPFLAGYRWHRVARMWRRRGVGELLMGSVSQRTLAASTPELKPRARVIAQRFDQGTQRAILRLYRSAPEDHLARAGEQLGRITCPALVLWGERDPYIAPSFAQAYADALPDATAQVIPDAGHWPWLAQPAIVRTVSSFLER